MTIDPGSTAWRRLVPAFLVAALLLAFLIYGPGAGPPPEDPTAEAPAQLTQPLPETPPGWEALPPGPLASRTGQAAIWTGEQLIVWGGHAIGRDHASGAVYSPDAAPAGSWQLMAAAPIDGGAGPAAAWTRTGAFLFTGAAAWFSPETNLWRSLASPPVTPSHPMSAAWAGNQVILVGYERHPPTFEDNLFAVAYGPDGECCRRLPDPPIDLSYGRTIWTGEQLLLIGGFATGDDAVGMLGFAAYDPSTGAWEELPPPPLNGGGEISASWTGTSLLAVGYELDSALWKPDEEWSTIPNAPFEFAACFPRTAAIGSTVFAWYCRQAALLDSPAEGWVRIATPELDPHAVSTSCLPVNATETVLLWCGNGDGAEPFFWEIDPTEVVALR